MTDQDLLALAALLHDIGKFRMRHIQPNKRHQEHSYEFVTEDFGEFFSPCGDAKNAILNHHTEGKDLIGKQVILADKLSAKETEDEAVTATALTSVLSKLKSAANRDETFQYPITALNFEKRETVIPSADAVHIEQNSSVDLWQAFTDAFGKATAGKTYTSAFYQTLVALLQKYTSRIPSETANPDEADISLYDHLRTTAAIAVCIGHELNNIECIDKILANLEASDDTICALIKGDISGIQSFLYQILSEGAARRLRGRSFYLQLLTEAIGHYVLKQLALPITNLILASGGQFYILAPHTQTQDKISHLRQQITEKLLKLHQTDLYCILDYTDVNVSDFAAHNFADKWDEVGKKVHDRKQKKWSELDSQAMFGTLFEPQENTATWDFRELGKDLRNAKYLVAFEVPESTIHGHPNNWHAAIKAFGWDIRICENIGSLPEDVDLSQPATVYRMGSTDFLDDAILQNFQSAGIDVSYDFRIFYPVIAKIDEDKTADYNAIADASEGVNWLGALRMDVDDLGNVFKERLENATISRLATLSEALRLFFEGYVPALCDKHNNGEAQILELIYAGGDDLFLVGGWSALPEIAEQIRCEFQHFVTGDHITLSGGIAIEHKKYPLYQFAAQSGDAEHNAKRIDGKNAITFLREPMKWDTFEQVRHWHQKFWDAVGADTAPLPTGFLTRLAQIQIDKKRWAWRSLYYLHRLEERYKPQRAFLEAFREALQPTKAFRIREFIPVITRWTALRIRK